LEYRRDYTPVLNWISPRVVYNSARTEFHFNPQNILSLITGLGEEDKAFVNARISGSLVDFEESVDHETVFSGFAANRARGEVGELPVGSNHTISMLWETGLSTVHDRHALWCSYDGEECYYAKYVPVIFSADASKGYYTGG
jgi:hypothetical protein